MTGRNGVFSFARYDAPGSEDIEGSRISAQDDHLRCVRLLKKAVKVMSHELGHCFGMKHCVHFNCLMQGSNSAAEASKKFFELCPLCLRKTYFAVEFDAFERYRRLQAWIENLIKTNPALMAE